MNTITLTDIQKQALNLTKNVCVKAGAGSGKTSILVLRFIEILKTYPQLPLNNILAITFTRKAAAEMKARIYQYAQELPLLESDLRKRILSQINQSHISTIHAFCRQIIQEFPIEMQVPPQCEVLEQDLIKVLKRDAIHTTLEQMQEERHQDLSQLLRYLSQDKIIEYLMEFFEKQNQIFTSKIQLQEENQATKQANEITRSLIEAFRKCEKNYTLFKEKHQKLDQDDLVELVRNMLPKNPKIAKEYCEKFKFIMIDEFQDTDEQQWEIIRYLFKDPERFLDDKKLFVVGDEKQSIYSFRGSGTALFLKLGDLFLKNPENSITVDMQENFRSSPYVINFINGIFEKIFSENKIEKINYSPLIAKNESITSNSFVEWILMEEDTNKEDPIRNEAIQISNWILEKQAKDPSLCFSDFAILFRQADKIDVFKEILTGYNIPNFIHKGKIFYQKQEILDLYMLLKGLVNPSDNLAWIGVLKSPLFGISDMALYYLYNIVKEERVIDKIDMFVDLYENKNLKENDLSESDIFLLRSAKEKIKSWLLKTKGISITDLMEYILADTGAWAIYASDQNGEQKIANIKKIIQKIQVHTKNSFFSWYDITEIFTYFVEKKTAESEENISPLSENTVALMTIHAAKGLEFPIVILPQIQRKFHQFSNGILCHPWGIGLLHKVEGESNLIREPIQIQCQKEQLEEEKRILYVACTRAKRGLLLSCKYTVSAIKTQKSEPPPPRSFLDLILTYANPNIEHDSVRFSFNQDAFQKTIYPKFYKKVSQEDEKRVYGQGLSPSSKKIGWISLEQKNDKKINTISVPQKISVSELLSGQNQSEEGHYQIPSELTCSSLHRYQGEIIHYLITSLNQLPSQKEWMPNDYLNQLAFPIHLKTMQPLLGDIKEHLKRFVESDTFKKIRSAIWSLHEESFAIKIGSKLIQGRIDTIIQTEKGIEIIDYKTDAVTEKTYQEKAQKYCAQLGLYALACQILFSIQHFPIIGKIYFTKIGKEVSFIFKKEELASLMRQSSQ